MTPARRLAQWVLYLGMTVCMVGGAPWPHPNYLVVLLGALVISAGIVLIRRANQHAKEGSAAAGSLCRAVTAMPWILDRVRALHSTSDTDELSAVARQIEKIHAEGIEAVAASQDDFVRQKSFLTYASVMAPLATAERLLYRAWSAASDGHREECLRSVKDALSFVEEAQRALDLAMGASPGAAAYPSKP